MNWHHIKDNARYIVLLFLFLLSAYLSSMTISNIWWSQFLLNLSAGIFGSLLVILLVDRALEKERKRERHERESIALQRLRPYIYRHVGHLCSIFKAVTVKKPDPFPTELRDVLTENFPRLMLSLDLTKKIAPTAQDWFTYLSSETKDLKGNLEKIIDTYQDCFNVESLEILESFRNSPLLNLFLMLPAIRQTHSRLNLENKRARANPFILQIDFHPIVINHMLLVLDLVEHVNSRIQKKICIEEVSFFRDDYAPQWGSSRL